MVSRKHQIGTVCILLIAIFFSACNSKTQFTVEPPNPVTPTGPLNMEEAQLLLNTRSAVEQGDPEFWKNAGESFYPILHPSFASVDDFVNRMDQYTSVFDFQCQAVLRFPKVTYSGDVKGQILSLVFTASGNESYQAAAESHAVLVPEIGVFEVRYLMDENQDKSFYLDDAGFIASSGSTLEELYQNLISSRKNRMGEGLQIDPCP